MVEVLRKIWRRLRQLSAKKFWSVVGISVFLLKKCIKSKNNVRSIEKFLKNYTNIAFLYLHENAFLI